RLADTATVAQLVLSHGFLQLLLQPAGLLLRRWLLDAASGPVYALEHVHSGMACSLALFLPSRFACDGVRGPCRSCGLVHGTRPPKAGKRSIGLGSVDACCAARLCLPASCLAHAPVSRTARRAFRGGHVLGLPVGRASDAGCAHLILPLGRFGLLGPCP